MSPATLTTMTDILREFAQSLQANSGTELQTGHNHFNPRAFQFINHYWHLIPGHSIVLVTIPVRSMTLRAYFSSEPSLITCFWSDSPPPLVGQGLLIHEVSISHPTTHQTRQELSGRVISSSQRPLPDNTLHSKQTYMPPVEFEPTNSAEERPYIYALDRASTGTGRAFPYTSCISYLYTLRINYLTRNRPTRDKTGTQQRRYIYIAMPLPSFEHKILARKLQKTVQSAHCTLIVISKSLTEILNKLHPVYKM